jgi:hypothetical protein
MHTFAAAFERNILKKHQAPLAQLVRAADC